MSDPRENRTIFIHRIPLDDVKSQSVTYNRLEFMEMIPQGYKIAGDPNEPGGIKYTVTDHHLIISTYISHKD